jgi:hypothetical protein
MLIEYALYHMDKTVAPPHSHTLIHTQNSVAEILLQTFIYFIYPSEYIIRLKMK